MVLLYQKTWRVCFIEQSIPVSWNMATVTTIATVTITTVAITTVTMATVTITTVTVTTAMATVIMVTVTMTTVTMATVTMTTVTMTTVSDNGNCDNNNCDNCDNCCSYHCHSFHCDNCCSYDNYMHVYPCFFVINVKFMIIYRLYTIRFTTAITHQTFLAPNRQNNYV